MTTGVPDGRREGEPTVVTEEGTVRLVLFTRAPETLDPMLATLERDHGIGSTPLDPESVEKIDAATDCVVCDAEEGVVAAVRERDAEIPIVALYDDHAAVPGACEAGADRCIHRGGTDATLSAHVARAVTAEARNRRTERALRRESEFVREAMDAIPDLFFVFDLNGRFVRWNDRFAATTGYDDATIAGMEPIEFIAGEHRERIAEAIDRVIEAGSAKEEADLLTRSGERVPYEFTGARLERSDSEDLIAGIGRDITDRRRKQRALSETADRLRTTSHVNRVTREVTRSLVHARTREEIEERVCRNLSETEPYRLAWIGEYTATSERVTPRTWAGAESGYLDERPSGPGETHVTAETACRTGEIQVAQRIAEDPAFAPWREAALSRGYRSAIAVPLVHRNTSYGVLCLYAPRPEAFDDEERGVLGELGETIAYAISAAESRRALISDTVTELEFAIGDRSVGFVDLSAAASCTVTVEGVTPTAEGIVAFVGVEGADPETIVDLVAGDPEAEATVVAEHDSGWLLRLTGPEPSVAGTLADYGCVVREARATEGDGRFVVELPQGADVRAVVRGIEDSYEATTLRSQRERDRSATPDVAIRQRMTDALTDRQREVLRVAHLSGYFEWPRRNSGEEMADLLGISQPTFHEHIRGAKRKLADAFFEEEPPVDVTGLPT
ncbi:bacterio-opsin activator domain-containing protein [Natronorarus salvus]|uniref:bacterio-opsin activator domain-containing protein n=1 Tax=Natronorarus salvus TaxID=3117733 RepID=UPI002F2657C7